LAYTIGVNRAALNVVRADEKHGSVAELDADIVCDSVGSSSKRASHGRLSFDTWTRRFDRHAVCHGGYFDSSSRRRR
jgi:hypothetical protein